MLLENHRLLGLFSYLCLQRSLAQILAYIRCSVNVFYFIHITKDQTKMNNSSRSWQISGSHDLLSLPSLNVSKRLWTKAALRGYFQSTNRWRSSWRNSPKRREVSMPCSIFTINYVAWKVVGTSGTTTGIIVKSLFWPLRLQHFSYIMQNHIVYVS